MAIELLSKLTKVKLLVDLGVDIYNLIKYQRSNQNTLFKSKTNRQSW